MDMRVPLQVTAERVNCGNPTELLQVIEVMKQVIGILVSESFPVSLSLKLTKEALIGNFEQGISGCHEKQVQSRSVLAEPGSVFFRDCKDDMPMFLVDTHRRGFLGENFLFFNLAGIAEL